MPQVAKCMTSTIKYISLLILFPIVLSAPAQAFAQNEDVRTEKWRQKIDLDYNVPDYSIKKPDAKVMGWRLAKILQSLEQNYTQDRYNHYLALILSHQMDDGSPYMPIYKVKILNIQKQDNIITVRIKLFSKTKASGKIEQEIPLTFVNSVSEDGIANTLFSELGQYIRKEN